MSLVADYGSEHESDDDAEEYNEVTKVHCLETLSVDTNSSKKYLSADGSDSSSDLEDVIQEDCHKPRKEKLPNPLLNTVSQTDSNSSSSGSSLLQSASVFANPFKNAAIAKQSLLEKHVKLTVSQVLIGKKAKVCRQYKLGRCRFGKNCQYSHDLDSILSARYQQEELVTDNVNTVKIPPHLQLPPPPKGQSSTGHEHKLTHHRQLQFKQQNSYMHSVNQEDDDDDQFNVGDKRKKRVGLSQSLIPPKRAMTSLHKQRMEERPWTLQKK